jgi:hypothetical protein
MCLDCDEATGPPTLKRIAIGVEIRELLFGGLARFSLERA